MIRIFTDTFHVAIIHEKFVKLLYNVYLNICKICKFGFIKSLQTHAYRDCMRNHRNVIRETFYDRYDFFSEENIQWTLDICH